jgi:hypothetical protein
MTRNTTCNECGGTMQRGFVVETRGSRGIPYEAAYWLEGKPEKSFWGGLKTEERQSYYITAYRCENCGFLKFYAGPAAIKK